LKNIQSPLQLERKIEHAIIRKLTHKAYTN